MILRFRLVLLAAAMAAIAFVVSRAESGVRLAIERPLPVYRIGASEEPLVPLVVALESDPGNGWVREFALGVFLVVGERPAGDGMFELDYLVLEDDETLPPPGVDTLRRRWEVTPDRERMVEACRGVVGAPGGRATEVHLHAGVLVRVDEGQGTLEERRFARDVSARVLCSEVD